MHTLVAPARVVSRAIANHRVAGSNPPDDKGIFSDSAYIRRLWPFLRQLQLMLPKNPPGISNGLQREAPPRMSRGGVGTLFKSESFPS